MILLGVTGGIGTGKTLICKILEKLGHPVYYADQAAQSIVEEDAEVMEKIKNLLGPEAYVSGKYNKPFVRTQVFNHPVLLEQLNAIVHPAVAKDTEAWILKYKDRPLLVKEAAIMYKQPPLSHILWVSAPTATRIKNIMARDPFRSESDILKIISTQNTEEAYAKIADFRIKNDGTSSIFLALWHILEQLGVSTKTIEEY